MADNRLHHPPSWWIQLATKLEMTTEKMTPGRYWMEWVPSTMSTTREIMDLRRKRGAGITSHNNGMLIEPGMPGLSP
jgi:hypothetical protein